MYWICDSTFININLLADSAEPAWLQLALSLSLSHTLALTLTLTSQSEPGSLLTLSGTGERNPAGACIRIRSSWAFWAAAEANAPDELPAEGHFRRPSSFRLRFFFWDWDGLHCTLLLFDVDSSDADTDNLI